MIKTKIPASDEALNLKRKLSFELRTVRRMASGADPAKRLAIAQRCLAAARQAEMPDFQLRFCFECAKACLHLGRPEVMQAYLADAGAIAGQSDDAENRAHYCTMMGAFNVEGRNLPQALPLLLQALELLDGDNCDRSDLVQALLSMGKLHLHLADHRQALPYLLRCLNIQREIGHLAGQAPVQQLLGRLYAELDDSERALGHFTLSLEISRTLDATLDIALSLDCIGGLLSRMGKPQNALIYLFEAQELYDQLDNRKLKMHIKGVIGDAYHCMGETKRALAQYESMLAQGADYPDLQCQALAMLGQVHQEQGSYARCIRFYEQAVDLCARWGFAERRVELTGRLADVFAEQGDIARALEHRKRSIKLQQELLDSQRQIPAWESATQEARNAKDDPGPELRQAAEHSLQQLEEHEAALAKTTIDLLQKNAALRELQKTARQYARKSDSALRQLATHVLECYNECESRTAATATTDAVIARAYREFTARLRAAAPELTTAELRVCLLIKLNLSIKQIAATLLLSTETVRSHRKQIRRKLGLNADANVDFFIRSLPKGYESAALSVKRPGNAMDEYQDDLFLQEAK